MSLTFQVTQETLNFSSSLFIHLRTFWFDHINLDMTLVWGPWFYLSKEAIRVLSLRNYSHPHPLRAMWLLSAGKIWFYLKRNYLLETLPPLAPNIWARVSVVVVLHWPLGEYRLASSHVVMLHLLYTAHATSFCSFICLFIGDRVSFWSWRQPVTHYIASDWP